MVQKYFLKTEHTASIKDSSMYKHIAARMQEGNIMLRSTLQTFYMFMMLQHTRNYNGIHV